MAPSVLFTGASGYLGGTVLAQVVNNTASPILPRSSYDKIYAMVRTDAQVSAIEQHYSAAGVEPLQLDHKDEAAVKKVLLEKGITVVFYLIDAFGDQGQKAFIKALGSVRKERGREVHFLHTTGAKMFSSHCGAPTDRPLPDDDPNLYEIQRKQKAPVVAMMQTPVDTNNTVIELCEEQGVKAYIFAPCIVYGKGDGFGNPISIQTKAIVQSAKVLRTVYSVDEGEPTWPVCHVTDTATLYLHLLQSMLSNSNPPSGKQGYYLASPGSVRWIDLYRAMAKALHSEGVTDTAEVSPAEYKILAEMGKALKCEPNFVPVQLGGKCTFEARRGRELGWKPKYPAEHAIGSAREEVRLILANL